MVRRFTRWLRLVVLVVAAAGLLPVGDLAAPGEDPVDHSLEVAADGAACADDCATGCADHGCTGLTHHCGCCGLATTALPPRLAPRLSRGPALRVRGPTEPPALRALPLDPVHRPPIA